MHVLLVVSQRQREREETRFAWMAVPFQRESNIICRDLITQFAQHLKKPPVPLTGEERTRIIIISNTMWPVFAFVLGNETAGRKS